MAELDHIKDVDNDVVYDLKDKTARQTITENEIYFRKMFCVHMGNAGGAEQIPGYGWYNNVDITLTSIIGAFDVSGMDGAFLRIIFRESPHYDYTLPIIIRAFESDYHREVFCHVYTDTNKTEELKITGTETIDFIYDKVNRCFFVVGRSSTGDLANYYTKSQTDNLLNAKANAADLSAVATSGDYNDLSNLPTIPAAQVPSDWNATAGVARILNKPNLSAVATSGNYSDLNGAPTLAPVATSGDYDDLSNLPTIPAAQVPSDWNATAGVARILNKPNLSAVATSGNYSDLNGAPTLAPVATSGDYDDLSNKPDLSVLQYLANIAAADDFNPGTSYSYLDFVKYNDRLYLCKSLSGSTAGTFDPTEWNEIIIGEQVAQAQRTFLLATQNGNRLDNLAPVATSGDYSDLSGTPAIPAPQINSDWNATGTVAEILNKPNLSAVANSGLYADLIGSPTLAPVATSGDYDDLTDKPTFKTINGNAITGTGDIETASLQTTADTGNKSVPNNSITKIAEIRLTKGLWIITATIGFANTSTNNDRVAIFSTAAASSAASNFEAYCRIRAAATSWTDIPMSCIYNATGLTTLYLYGLQDSGTTLNSRCFGIRAAKIA